MIYFITCNIENKFYFCFGSECWLVVFIDVQMWNVFSSILITVIYLTFVTAAGRNYLRS
jgi:hypothetical protein